MLLDWGGVFSPMGPCSHILRMCSSNKPHDVRTIYSLTDELPFTYVLMHCPIMSVPRCLSYCSTVTLQLEVEVDLEILYLFSLEN